MSDVEKLFSVFLIMTVLMLSASILRKWSRNKTYVSRTIGHKTMNFMLPIIIFSGVAFMIIKI